MKKCKCENAKVHDFESCECGCHDSAANLDVVEMFNAL